MNSKSFPRIVLCLLLALSSAPFQASASEADISVTKHNLSISGPGPIKSSTEQEMCVFCHTPHRARTDTGLLWNRGDSAVNNYTTYESSSMLATPEQPSGASKLCLSCHDGTIALGAVLSRDQEIEFAGGVRFLPDGDSLIGSDLSDDHPVSFLYDENLANTNGELHSPSILTNQVKLDASGRLQCTACHDPHDNTLGNFLTQSLSYSNLCLTCHDPTDWSGSSHANSLNTWDGVGTDPWPHTEFNTVAENACLNCHLPHNAGADENLLRFPFEEDNCITCHNGNIAATDIESELAKSFRHPVQDTTGVHKNAEDPTSFMTSHVECADCHNPHRVSDLDQSPPLVKGVQLGVSGINNLGLKVEDANFAYEICFKCHADNNVLTFVDINRQLSQINTRLEFDLTNPSYHPVEGAGKNPNVPSLLSPLNENSIIYCTDCHANDGGPGADGPGPAGPHGSEYPHLLERNYTTLDQTQESSFEYALCYKCHDRNSILNDESFTEHGKHIEDQDTPCSACHDPHGVSASQGTPMNNTHLINFDRNIVSPNASGVLQFEELGTFRGSCSLSCHGEEHNMKTYPAP